MAVNDIRTIKLSKMIGMKYDCTNEGCSSLSTIYVSSMRLCQLACLNSIQCRTVNFYKSSNQCELFVDIAEQFGVFVTNTDVISMTVIDNRKLSAPKKTTTTTVAPTCANACPSGLTSNLGTTCGRICHTDPLGNFGSPTGSVGSTGNCNVNSTFCPGGTYTVTRNTYSTVNFDCQGPYGCNAYGGCCIGIGSPSSPAIYCISCHY